MSSRLMATVCLICAELGILCQTWNTSEASPQTAESCRISSQYSRWLASLIDAFHTTVKRRLGSPRRLSAPSGDIALQGTHRLIQRRHGELAKAFDPQCLRDISRSRK